LLSANAAMAVDPPGWWYDPSPGVGGLVYQKGSAEKCATESVAVQAAWDNGLAAIRKGITDNTNIWPGIHLVGTDIAHEATQKDAFGRWYAWVLVSCPQTQLDKALARAKEFAEKAQQRIPIFVCPLSFGKQSEEQFPEVVKKYKARGYGNAIWQTVEDLLYEQGYEIVTAPSSQTKSLLQQMFGHSSTSTPGAVKLPDKVLLCNMNFFEVKTESLSWGTLARNSEYHAELLLELYDLHAEHSNVKIPSKGEARNKDLLTATQNAATQAVQRLVERVKKQ